ncbi:MAG: hypothetical protein HONBIEJF_02940 [Fimbriimonadaceae bacterium]|nr:hypothetical protein [Fimbriimonadaceae bacterium]
MDPILTLLLDSWNRNRRILANITSLVTDGNKEVKSSEDSFSIKEHLCHIHEVRHYWLGQVSKDEQAKLGDVYSQEGDTWIPIDDLAEIRRQLEISGQAVHDAVKERAGNGQAGAYDDAIYFLQHMLWHDGYHFACILVGLRNAGNEPTEEWDEANVWGVWRDESRRV